MSSPIGATHALEEMVWKKRPIITDRHRYDLTFCDSATGHVELHLYDLSSSEARKELEHWERVHQLKGFAYPR